jgi:DNA-binding SARP family transcriptional activator
VHVDFAVLGPVMARDARGVPLALKGPRHRAVLARLLIARGRVVPVSTLVDDLWADPPQNAIGAIRTFVGDLRRALEPDRPPHAPATLLVTEGAGYALSAEPDAVDALRFEQVVSAARSLAPERVLDTLSDALGWWRGPAYADFSDERWARPERSRLSELRLRAVELQAQARLDLGRPADAVPELDAHVAEHPWREEGWRLLALSLYRSGRQGDALQVLRRARTLLVEQLGVDPGAELQQLERDVLNQEQSLTLAVVGAADADAAGVDATRARAWVDTAALYGRTVAPGSRARLRSTVDLLRSLAITGGEGLEAARDRRLGTILAAEETGDIALTARVIGAYDVPAIWSRSDDPEQAALIVAAAERTLAALDPEATDSDRARLLATIAIESRGATGTRGEEAALQAEQIARRLDDPALLVFALNGVFMQSFHRAGLALQRDALGQELVELSARHGLDTSELLGYLIRIQALSALGDLEGADAAADAADRLADRYESPLVGVFTAWYRALRLAESDALPAEVAAAYRSAARRLDGAGMPGLANGLLPLALLALRVRLGRPAATDDLDWGPYEPWARPLVLLALDRRPDAAAALRELPEPPHDHLREALWCLAGRAAIDLGDREIVRRAYDALLPAASERAGAGSGLFTLGPVYRYLDELAAALE